MIKSLDISYIGVANTLLVYGSHYEHIIINKYIKFLFCNYMCIEQLFFLLFSAAPIFLLISTIKKEMRNVENK